MALDDQYQHAVQQLKTLNDALFTSSRLHLDLDELSAAISKILDSLTTMRRDLLSPDDVVEPLGRLKKDLCLMKKNLEDMSVLDQAKLQETDDHIERAHAEVVDQLRLLETQLGEFASLSVRKYDALFAAINQVSSVVRGIHAAVSQLEESLTRQHEETRRGVGLVGEHVEHVLGRSNDSIEAEVVRRTHSIYYGLAALGALTVVSLILQITGH